MHVDTPTLIAAGLSILVVDGDPGSRALAISSLASRRCATEASSTMAGAFAIMSAHTFDAVLTEVELPDGSGTDVLDVLRSSAPGTLVIAMSSRATPSDRAHLLWRGFDACVGKPLHASELGAVLERLDAMRRVA